ncbi:F510_1955 family glycosylhydrolase [Cohnella massiliensis]|uniref:F510_1955 family glycosylhydrolase n=1 Tax=Cohnella massiliensis TaxID=1816691 RepID=UPI0009BBF4AA|nr:hypothetical protein [Cohnella massiliensis]
MNFSFIIFLGISIVFLIVWITYVILRKEKKYLDQFNNEEIREKLNQLSKVTKGIGWLTILSTLGVIISGIVWAATARDVKPLPKSDAAEMTHVHGMSYTADGNKLVLATHEGLRYYENGNWSSVEGQNHDYMGFSATDDGFYSSGHPAPGSKLKDPFGIIKSTVGEQSFQQLALYGEMDFHGMSVGFKSHAIYVLNPASNGKMSSTGLYYSLDQAQTWTRSESSGLEGQVQALAVHPTEESTLAIGTNKGAFLSTDYGQTFKKIGVDGPATSLFFNNDGTLWAGGFQLTLVNPETLQNETVNLPDLEDRDMIEYVAQNPMQSQTVAFITFNNLLYITNDAGDTWKQVMIPV